MIFVKNDSAVTAVCVGRRKLQRGSIRGALFVISLPKVVASSASMFSAAGATVVYVPCSCQAWL